MPAGKAAVLARILDLERSQGFADRAVMGGLDRFIEGAYDELPWLSELGPIKGRSYAALGPGERRAWAEAALGRASTTGTVGTAGGGATLRPARPDVSGSKGGRGAARGSRQGTENPGATGRVSNPGSISKAEGVKKSPSALKGRSPKQDPASTPNPSPRPSPSRGEGVKVRARRAVPSSMAKPARAAYPLDTALEDLSFIPKPTRGKLKRLNIQTLRDLMWLFPNRHIDYSKPTKVMDLEWEQETTVIGHVVQVEKVPIGPPPGAAKILISDGSGLLTATFFRQAYLADQLKRGTVVALSGKIGEFKGRAQMENPEYEVLPRSAERNGPGALVHAGNLLPVYPSTEGLQQRSIRNATRKSLDAGLSQLTEHLPASILERHALPALPEAVSDMHFPARMDDYAAARRRLAFDELFMNQVEVVKRRNEWRTRGAGVSVPDGPARVQGFLDSLDFRLTGDQQQALSAILGDMSGGVPMGRLLQGEVGSGKTVVALAALLAAAGAGHQGAFMAPTEVLAEQHFLSTCRQLGAEPVFGLPEVVRAAEVPGLGRGPVRVALLIGSLGGRVKTEVHRLTAMGEIDILIGTHALLQEAVLIPRLGLAVVDEQHRFGVGQRGALTKREPRPHLLAMSATPIPRTLSLTIYGDLDTSTLREMPAGRRPIQTRWARTDSQRSDAYNLVRTEVAAGRQAFVVNPLIEESEQVTARAATTEFERLSQEVFPNLRVGLLHGRMPLAEKQTVMNAFRARETDVLVATPVIEVGVDIPNATVMLIESADRFGLAQLHQFRGRVGRGGNQSYCVLLADNPSEDARARLSAVERTNDGFELAEEDLRLRGPGEVVGTRQSGWSQHKVATPADTDLLDLAREEATALLAADPYIRAPKHRALAAELERIAVNRPAEFS